MSDKPKAKHLRVVKTGEDHEQLIRAEDPAPINLDVVEALGALVDRAKAGEIIGFAFALQLTDEMISTDYVGDIVAYQTIGMLEELKINVLAEIHTAQEDDD